MVYLGREIWLFLTEDGRPDVLYSVSGRSQTSRQREAVYYPRERRVAIGPSDKLEKADPLRHYDAMKLDENLLVVSNGSHTKDIYDAFYSFDRGTEALRNILNRWGPEPDSLHTPRIAGVIERFTGNPLFYLAIISETNSAKSMRIQPRLGTSYGISTYSGKGADPEPFDISKLARQHMLPNIRVDGKSPEDITEFFVSRVIDSEFFVCCSAAVLHDETGEWNVSVLNKSE